MGKFTLNGQEILISPGKTLFQTVLQNKPHADIILLNGFHVEQDCYIEEHDTVVAIKSGEVPPKEVFESLLIARHTPDIHRKLKKAIVGIAGLGGLGSTVAVALARAGIGKLILVDYDIVEPTNLNRQQYFIEHTGKYKTDAVSEIIGKVNPYTKIISHKEKINEDNISEFFEQGHVIVEALDKAATKAMFIENILDQLPEKPIVCGMGMAGYGRNTIISMRQVGNLYICGDGVSEVGLGQGLMAPRVGIVANMQANQVIELLVEG